jgi:siderophore synthetase component
MNSLTEQKTSDALQVAYQNILAGELDPEEQRVLRFLKAKVPQLADAYLLYIPKARQTILLRLAASLLREDVLGFASEAYDLCIENGLYTLEVPEVTAEWESFLLSLKAYDPIPLTYKVYPLTREEWLVTPVGDTFAFRRLDIEGHILHVAGGKVRPLEHAVELLHLLRLRELATVGCTANAWQRLAEELRNGSANLALGYAHEEEQRQIWRQLAAEYKTDTALGLMLARKKQDPHFDAALFFEQLCVEGHNLHPGAKTKIGMEPDAVYRYAPEFGGITDIRFVAIRCDHAEFSAVEAVQHPNDLLFAQYPELETAVRREWERRGLDLAQYVLTPVHPWQYDEAIPKIYRDEIAAGIVVPVESFSVPCGATSSFRTVVPLGRGPKVLALKVAVNSQMTSTVRSISANTTQNAARFTRMIRDIMSREPKLHQTFVPVSEVAGYCFKVREERDPELRTLKSRNLSAVLRENVESFTSEDELAIVGSALYAVSPISGKRILAELVEAYAATTGAPSLQTAAHHFVRDYAEIALPGFLTLMVRYGVGLEGHLQNSVPVFRGGRPVRMLFRDWGGARLYSKRLDQSGMELDFYPGSVTVTEDVKDMQNKVFYTVFQNHISEIILQICKQYGVSEGELWREIRLICDRVFAELATDPACAAAVAEDREALYRPQVEHKALTKMRLEPEDKGYRYAQVSNPLHQPAEV